MKQSRWSPADLDRQRLVVRRIALRSDVDLRQLKTARDRLVADVRSLLGGPLALVGCFVAGAVIGGRRPPKPQADEQRNRNRQLIRTARILRKILTLSAAAYGPLRAAVVPSRWVEAKDARDDVARQRRR